MTCGAYTERYTGKGAQRQKHAGSCIYERGHDGDHCPPSLANVDWVAVPKIEMAEAKAIAKRLDTLDEGPEDTGSLAALIASWPDPS